MSQYTVFKVIEGGNLKISLTPEGKELIEEMRADSTKGWLDIITELFEYEMCNGYSYVQPEHIGALTSSLIIGDGFIDEDTSIEDINTTNTWWFPDYQVLNEIDELYEKGYIIFQKE